MLIHRIVCVGVNFRTAPVEYREKLGSDLPVLCERVCARAHAASNGDGEAIRELAWLSTCNRVELYALVGENGGTAPLVAILADAAGLNPKDVAGHTYRHCGYEAVRHLCRVASGLDSMVLGEPQILGQVAQALTDGPIQPNSRPGIEPRLSPRRPHGTPRAHRDLNRQKPREHELGCRGTGRQRRWLSPRTARAGHRPRRDGLGHGQGASLATGQGDRSREPHARPRRASLRAVGIPRIPDGRACGGSGMGGRGDQLHELPAPDRRRGSREGRGRAPRRPLARLRRHRGPARHRSGGSRASGRPSLRRRRLERQPGRRSRRTPERDPQGGRHRRRRDRVRLERTVHEERGDAHVAAIRSPFGL